MQPSLTLCRAQEARQWAIAAAASLDNVKAVATAAAQAWAKEGIAADRRETRKQRAVEAEDMNAHDLQSLDFDRLLSENPDRSHADEHGKALSVGN